MSNPNEPPEGAPGPARIRVGGAPPLRSPDSIRWADSPQSAPDAPTNASPAPPAAASAPFVPPEPRDWDDLGVDPGFAEHLILRYLLVARQDSSRGVAAAICVAWPLVKDVLDHLKNSKLLVHRGSTAVGDFISELTDAGRVKAMETRRVTAYVGPMPVPWEQYLDAVEQQTLVQRTPGPDDLHRAFADLSVPEDLLERLGPAIASAKAMFLHGEPGNGKTSLAERITACFGDAIWIPQTLLVEGHIVKLYDSATHQAVEPEGSERFDRRWVRVRRPTVIAGGELTLDMLEIQFDAQSNVSEAPLQLKANCGTLVIDDFGRQRMPPQELLNRWIFPLERRVDFLRLPDGRKVTAPFDALLIFSTNLEPRDLADEAFLRRIPYKIHVSDPTEEEFRSLLEHIAAKLGVTLSRGSLNYLVERHYKMPGRPMRFCHPRDLLLQIVHVKNYERKPLLAGPPEWDRAVQNYFGLV